MIYKENYFKFYPVPLRKHEFTLVKIKESKNVKCENKSQCEEIIIQYNCV